MSSSKHEHYENSQDKGSDFLETLRGQNDTEGGQAELVVLVGQAKHDPKQRGNLLGSGNGTEESHKFWGETNCLS